MAEKGHGAGGKAMVNLAKRAKRVQEKMMQKFGKSDQTRDEVYEEFVVNFNKQHASAAKLQKELTKYMNALRLLNQSTRSLADTIDELYESDWEGRTQYKSIVEKQGLLWDDKLTTLQSKMVEPMAHYVSRFPEVKNRIQKRERKVVDYDLTRRELESIKAKPKVTEQKIQQAEEAYTHAKQLYDEISDELYEELPSFYDSRIQFYASLIQSIATTEAKFDSEMAKVDEELADLMDSTASQAATGLHSTKRERSIIDRGPRLLSRPGDELEGSPAENDVHPPITSKPSTSSETQNHSSGSSSDSSPSSTPTRTSSSSEKPSKPEPFSGDSSSLKRPPTKPLRSNSSFDPEGAIIKSSSEEENLSPKPQSPVPSEEPPKDSEGTNEAPPTSPSPEVEETVAEEHYQTPKSPPPKPDPPSTEESEGQTLEDPEPADGTVDEQESSEVINPSNVLYKVRASHPYKGEDEDELSFEKGDIVLVIPFEDSDDEEEGWKMGVIEGTNRKGVFPENFTKPFQ